MVNYRHSEDDYRKAVKNSLSVADVCRNLGLLAAGGNYATVKRKINLYGLDTSHFTGQGWNKGNYTASPRSTTAIKKKLIRERGHQCENCKLEEWMGSPITLELEHVDGNNSNHVEDNLQLLCPNCHALTPTWRRAKSVFNEKPELKCPVCSSKKSARSITCTECRSTQYALDNRVAKAGSKDRYGKFKLCVCGTEIHEESKHCNQCRGTSQEKITWPNTEDLVNMIQESNYLKVSRELGVSDNAIRICLKVRGIDPITVKKPKVSK